MTGTAETEAAEFHDIYKLDVNMIQRIGRCGAPITMIGSARRGVRCSMINEIRDSHVKTQPVLVGTVSVEGPSCSAEC
jgi:preprotein translocase subunit SecA